MNIRTQPRVMTAQNEPSDTGEELEKDPEEDPSEDPSEGDFPEDSEEEEPAPKKRKTAKPAGGKRKRASDDDNEDEDDEDDKESEPPKKKKQKESNKAKESEEEPEEESEKGPQEEENVPLRPLWAVRDIISQRVTEDGSLQYFVDWESDEETGEKWDPSWELTENVVESPEKLAEWRERRAQRARSEEEVRAEAVDPEQIRVEDVPEEELPSVEERREFLYGRRRAGPKPKTESMYKKRKLVAMTAPK
ncbi:hypothetical protein QBC32DRAFT_314320 [Pseudoneurospora amorphoporcata]|uniref:Chromo domain-containing protein n=1 Tax=Pseudoneurospora amorphoporcata TaxID=241081 RepID=A0AAN6NVV1_9PEZI|nr:hypothetical protein QBC32DRAFT_314320 [Pseudoneurospora amorphoporcata]